MKKIILLYAKFWGGHLSAATAIKAYIDENFPWKYDVKLIDFFSYLSKTLSKISINVYFESLKYFPRVYWKIYDSTNQWMLSNIVKHGFNTLLFRMKSLLKKENPDIVISCHPYSSILCSRLKKRKNLNFSLGSIITDFALHEFRIEWYENIDYFFVSHDNMKKELIWRWVDSNKIYITWIPISNKYLWKFDKNEIKKSFWLSDGKKTILFFWWWEYGLANKKVLNILKSFIDYWEWIQIVVVSWKNKKMKSKFENLVKETKSDDFVKVLAYTNQVPELMSISDLIVTKPGWLTTTESLASWLPMLLINPIPWQEVDNTKFLEKNNIWIYIDEDNCEEIIDKLFSNDELLKKMWQKAKSISKANATEEICKAIGLSK